MKANELNKLVESGEIKSYSLVNLNDSGEIGQSHCRNTERATIEFPSGKKLVITAFCSGSLEDTTLWFSSEGAL